MGAKSVELNFKIEGDLKNGSYFKPMILEDVPLESQAYKEELFGPVFTLFRFSEDKEAYKIANDIGYGLGSSIFSKNIEKAKERALQLETGHVSINDVTITDPGIPNGGIKESGYGRECYKDGLTAVCNKKSIIVGK